MFCTRMSSSIPYMSTTSSDLSWVYNYCIVYVSFQARRNHKRTCANKVELFEFGCYHAAFVVVLSDADAELDVEWLVTAEKSSPCVSSSLHRAAWEVRLVSETRKKQTIVTMNWMELVFSHSYKTSRIVQLTVVYTRRAVLPSECWSDRTSLPAARWYRHYTPSDTWCLQVSRTKMKAFRPEFKIDDTVSTRWKMFTEGIGV